ncbi:MAG: hypothetical protein JW942_06885 [Opitutales bacterium]|nr:hypothetical protein [Opitutales bacterium]
MSDTVINVTMDELEGRNETAKFRDGQREIKPIAERLIEGSERLGGLEGLQIKYLFAKDEMKSKGKRVLGKACKFPERDRLLHPFRFCIILDERFWQDFPNKREPLLLHELLHCGVNDEGDPVLVPHDLEEFGEVVRRYGAWANDVVLFDRQLELFASEQRKAAP